MTKQIIGLGDIARDKLTGFEGTVIGISHFVNNCDRILIKPKGLHEGKPIPSSSFDLPDVERVGPGDLRPLPIDRGDVVEMGDDVEDRLTGVRGVVMTRTEWLAGCSTLEIQPKELKDGQPLPKHHCDEPHVTILARARPAPAVKTGGPRPEPRRR